MKNISSADREQYCLSFDTPQPFSRGRLGIWRSWNYRYKDVFLRNHASTSPYDKSLVKEILPENGSLNFKNISSADSKQYCLSLDTPQPFSRRSLCIWRCWKHREKVAYTWFWFWNMAQPVYIETFIAAKRLVIFEKYFVSRWKTILPFIWYPAAIQPRQIGYMAFLELSNLGCILAQSCQHIHIWQEFSQRYIAEKRLVKIEIYFVSRWQTILPFTCYPAAI